LEQNLKRISINLHNNIWTRKLPKWKACNYNSYEKRILWYCTKFVHSNETARNFLFCWPCIL